jgi:ribosomal protein L40E
MKEYVKICPVCGIHNSELADVCKGPKCHAYLDGVEPIPEPLTPEPDIAIEDIAAPEQTVSFKPATEQPAFSNNSTDTAFKVCPKCGTVNPEDSFLCVTPECNTGIAFEKVVRGLGEPGMAPQRIYIENPHFLHTVEVRSGQTVGQAHPTSKADVQLSGIPDIEYVSRSHCRFDFDGGAWIVTALPSTTNKTAVNGQIVPRGQSFPVHNGDMVTLATIPLRMRIME